MGPLPRLSGAGRRAWDGEPGRNSGRNRLICMLATAITYVGCHTVPLDVAAPPVANLGASPARLAQLETGRLIFTISHKCARCHRPKPIVDYSPEYWTQSIMPRMAEKAKLSEVEEKYLMAYILTAHEAIPRRKSTR
ncbi:MAG: hypothetical protein ACLQVF_10325 [Isosphaeraceae bacterium]